MQKTEKSSENFKSKTNFQDVMKAYILIKVEQHNAFYLGLVYDI